MRAKFQVDQILDVMEGQEFFEKKKTKFIPVGEGGSGL